MIRTIVQWCSIQYISVVIVQHMHVKLDLISYHACPILPMRILSTPKDTLCAGCAADHQDHMFIHVAHQYLRQQLAGAATVTCTGFHFLPQACPLSSP
jgi:hypothetical protein